MAANLFSRRAVLAAGLAGLARPLPAAVRPLRQAHAHNDYLHPRPLLDALEHGFCSVEADIHLVDGKLLVAHDLKDVRPDRTLEALYLDPLRERVTRNGNGVYAGGPPFTLLVDLKSEAGSTYAALRPVLAGYREILTRYTPGETRSGPVRIILSGNRPRALLEAETERYAALDGRLSDLEAVPSVHLMPLISDTWLRISLWRGQGALPEADHRKLRETVKRVRDAGRELRFWATPDTPEAWRLLRDSGVTLINTDNLAGLSRFLTGTGTEP